MNLSAWYGFTAEGLWRNKPLPPKETGILIDDRFLPNRFGILEALRALEAWNGIVILDFERPHEGLLSNFAKSLSGKRLVLPPAYADLTCDAVLVGPWRAECDFPGWLSSRRERFGHVVLDAAPLRVRCRPGGCRIPWTKPLPERGYPCPSLGCLHLRLPDGSILFWDTEQTFLARLNKAGNPLILFLSDLDALPDVSTLS